MSEGSQEPLDSAQRPEAPAGRLRLTWLIVFLVLLAAGVGGAIAFARDRSVRTVVLYLALAPLSVILVLTWWTFLSGLAWRVRRRGLLAVGTVFAALLIIFRFDGFDGDMKPRFSFRFSKTREQIAAEYRQSVSPEDPSKDAGEFPVLEVTDDDWPEYRGPRRDGIVEGVTLSRDFAANPPRELWKHPVDLGWGSFAIVGDYCWTMEQRVAQETVACYRLSTGVPVWEHSDATRFSETLGGDGPRSTPTYHEGRIYSQGATGILKCLNAFRKHQYWSVNVLEDSGAKNMTWGLCGSPLIVDDVVVVDAGGAHGTADKSVIAYELATGKIRWAKGKHPGGYAGLRLETLYGERQLVIFDGHGVAGLRPEDGVELWRFAWTNGEHVNAAQPIFRDQRYVFISASYSSGSALIDVTSNAGKWEAKPVWAKKNFFKLKFNDGVYRDGYVYGLDESYLSCIDLMTGQRKWKARSNTGYGQLLLFDDLLLIQCENGELAIAEASPHEYRELHRQPALKGKTWNVPAYSRGKLLLRNAEEAACYELRVVSSAATDSVEPPRAE